MVRLNYKLDFDIFLWGLRVSILKCEWADFGTKWAQFLRPNFLKLPLLLLWGWFGLMCLEVVTTGKMWQKAAHTESLPYNSLTWATSDHEKEEKMWCKRWNGFWLIDERSQKKSGFMVNNPIHQNTSPASESGATTPYSIRIQQKGQRLIRVKLSTKARIFLLAS